MSKKSRRSVSRRPGAASSTPVEFEPDYTHVKRDLTRIGVLAGVFFSLLVVLSFFLR